jgi:predicted MFS family arabinose efflux permease
VANTAGKGEMQRGLMPFRYLIRVQAAHSAGDATVAVALAGTLFFSVPIGEARDKVGIYLLLTMTPFALVSPVVGPLLDRWRGSYRLTILVAAVGRTLLALYLATRTDRLILYPLAFAMLVLSRMHGVSRCALIPEVLPKNKSLVSANALMSIWSVLGGAIVAGPSIGLQAWLGPQATLRFAAVIFGLCAWSAARLPRAEGSRRRKFIKGAHRLLSPRLLAAGFGAAASRACVGFLTFMLAFVLRQRGEGASTLAIVIGAAGIGAFLGAVAAPLLRVALRESLLLLASLGAIALVAFVFAAGMNVVTASIVAAVTGLGTASARLAFDSLIQRDAPEEVRGRTFARYETLFQICWVGGAGLATAVPFSSASGLRALGLIAIGGIALALWGAFRPSPG